MPAVLRVENLRLASRAGGDVRRDQLVFSGLLHALPNLEGVKVGRFQILEPEGFDPRPWRSLFG
jgi:hypothetical protein